MTVHTPLSGWIDARTPTPPQELASRVQGMTAGQASGLDAADALLASAEAALASVLANGCLTRESALDLLAVDALVTYAFEAAADDPGQIEERAKNALARIAALAQPYKT